MEWITALINAGVVLGLIGLIWRNQAKKVDEKQDKVMCDEKHIHINEKLGEIKETSDNNNLLLIDLAKEVALIGKAVNNGG